ncbi:unnamed protein product, partial [Polarella glacialis]
QQRLAHSACAAPVTAYVRCCRAAGIDARERLASPLSGEDAAACANELEAVARCVPGALLGGKGRPFEACEKSFKAVVGFADKEEGEEVDLALKRSWACMWRSFRQPMDQLVAQSQAVGECRPASAVNNTFGKGRWTA